MDAHEVRLTTSEIATLWTEYMYDNMGVYFLKYFIAMAEDTEIKRLAEETYQLCQRNVKSISEIFRADDIPIPAGFNEEDVNMNAPRLFSDTVTLSYIKNKAYIGMVGSTAGLTISTKKDVRRFYQSLMNSWLDVDERSTNILLSKGIFIRPPFIPVPEQAEFAKDEGFLGHVLGNDRSLHAVEITHLFTNIQKNELGRVLMIGFSQVAQSSALREFFLRGAEIAAKHIQVLGARLEQSNLSVPMGWDLDITKSTDSPFSDKLMMFLTTIINATGFSNYAISMAAGLRADIVADYSRLMAEIVQFGEDGANIAIKHGWMEIPPRAVDRKELALSK